MISLLRNTIKNQRKIRSGLEKDVFSSMHLIAAQCQIRTAKERIVLNPWRAAIKNLEQPHPQAESPSVLAQAASMNNQQSRRDIFRKASILAFCAAGGLPTIEAIAQNPIDRVGGSALKVSLNA